MSEPGSARSTLGTLVMVVAILAAFVLLPRILRRHSGPGVGRPAPDFDLPLVANAGALGAERASLKLSDLGGQAVLLDFWATWCEPCRVEAPIVDRVARRWRDKGVVVVGVDLDAPDQGDPRAFAMSRGLTYPIARDSLGVTSRAYGVEVLPTLVVVSRAGRVVAVRTQVVDGPELEELVQQGL